MIQYNFDNNILILKVKKSPFFVRVVLFFFSFAFFLFPLIGMILTITMRGRFYIGFLFVIILFGLFGFYLLRLSLWNTYGVETIIFNKSTIRYEVNYGWFKDGKKEINLSDINYTIKTIGYEEDEIGTLIITNINNNKIESVVKIPKRQIEELIEILKKEINLNFI